MGKCLSSCSSTTSSLDQNGKSSSHPPHHTKTSVTKPFRDIPSLPQPEEVHTPPNISQRDTLQSHAKLNPINSASEHIKMPRQGFSENKVSKLFEKYKDPGEEAILAEGMERFCQDLKVNPAEFIVLVLAWKFQASAMCRFTYSEFSQGCRTLKADSINGIRSKFSEMQKEVKEKQAFKDLYRFTFNFGLDSDSGQKSLPMEMAVPLWKLVFSQNPPDLLERWCNFLIEHEIRGISRDTWHMFLNFVESHGNNLDSYDDSEAWPSLFDDFVENERERIDKEKSEPQADGVYEV